MPRKSGFFVAGVANHIIQRDNNKEAVFFEEEGYRQYLTILNEAATKLRGKSSCLCFDDQSHSSVSNIRYNPWNQSNGATSWAVLCSL